MSEIGFERKQKLSEQKVQKFEQKVKNVAEALYELEQIGLHSYEERARIFVVMVQNNLDLAQALRYTRSNS